MIACFLSHWRPPVESKATLDQTEGATVPWKDSPGSRVTASIRGPACRHPVPGVGWSALQKHLGSPNVSAGAGLSIFSLTHSSCSASFCVWPSALRLQAVFLGPVFAASPSNPFIAVRTVTLTVSSSIPSQRAQTNQNLLWRVGLLLAWALEKWRVDIPITQTQPTLALKTSTAQTVTPHCQQTKQEVQSISKPKPKGVCQRDSLFSQGVWASGALLHFDFRGGALLGLEVLKRQTLKRGFSKFCLGGMRRREESGTSCPVYGGSNYHSEGPFYYRRVSKLV